MTKRTPTRLLLMAMPPPEIQAMVHLVYVRHDLISRARVKLVPPENLHQSLSERIFDPTTQDCDALLEVCAGIRAHACTLDFNRIEGRDGDYWTMHACGVPKAFDSLSRATRTGLTAAGFGRIAVGVTPHMTLCYRVPGPLRKIVLEPPISWTITELLLVIGGGEPYGYEVIGRWFLLPEIDPPALQSGLF